MVVSGSRWDVGYQPTAGSFPALVCWHVTVSEEDDNDYGDDDDANEEWVDAHYVCVSPSWWMNSCLPGDNHPWGSVPYGWPTDSETDDDTDPDVVTNHSTSIDSSTIGYYVYLCLIVLIWYVYDVCCFSYCLSLEWERDRIRVIRYNSY